jgi:hypothetical protein
VGRRIVPALERAAQAPAPPPVVDPPSAPARVSAQAPPGMRRFRGRAVE